MYNTHQKNLGSEVISLLLVMMMWVSIATAATCAYDFSPCTCSYYEAGNTNSITCYAPMADIAAAFQSKPALVIDSLDVRVKSEGDSIPADLLGQSRVIGQLTIAGALQGVFPILRVDPNAFRASKNNSLQSLNMGAYTYGLDASRLDFDFLIGYFPLVNTVIFYNLLNLDRAIPTLPSLPALTTLVFSYCSDMNKAFTDSVLKSNGLKHISFYLAPPGGSVPLLMDEGMSALMNWLLPSSANTLETIYLNDYSTSMTRTPPQLGSFKSLTSISIQRNVVNMAISAGSIFSSKPGMTVDLFLSNVVSVEEGAFLGNYAGAYMNFYVNSIRRLEAGAFKSVLEQVANSSSGQVRLSDNPIDCYTDPCHLAWLCRDNRNLLNYIDNARCNRYGELLSEMSGAYFANCPRPY